MAKKKATRAKGAETSSEVPPGQLGDWLPKVPEEVAEAAGEFDKAHSAQSKAAAKLKGAKEALIEKAKAAGCEVVPIRNGKKLLRIKPGDEKIVYEAPKKKPGDDDD